MEAPLPAPHVQTNGRLPDAEELQSLNAFACSSHQDVAIWQDRHAVHGYLGDSDIVVAFVLCELTAILGLMNYFLSGVPIFLLFALALIGLLLHFPRRAYFESAAAPTGQNLNNPTT